MADAAVRVDIIVGQNSVVPAVERTSASLQGAQRVATGLNGTFANLSNGGVRRLEAGFQALAFQAAGVPGPLGKIASGAVLLAGGSGILLAVAAAAGTLALIWKKFGAVSDEATEAIARMNKELHKQEQALLDIAAADAEVARQRGRAGFFAFFAEGGTSGILGWIAQHFSKIADEIERTADAYAALSAHGATDDWLMNFGKTHPMPKAGKPTKEVRQPDPAFDWWLNQDFTKQSVVRDLKEQMAELNAEMVKTPAIMEQVDLALDSLEMGFDKTSQSFLRTIELSAELVTALNQVLLQGIIDLGVNLATALGEGGGFGDVIVAAFGKMMQDIGALLIQFGVELTILRPLLSNLFLSGPAMIAAGILISAAGAAVSKRAQSQSVPGHSASGGMDGNRYQNDQQTIAARGTVTVSMKGGFIDPRSPDFQEFLAQVIKEAKGRNVVFA